MASHVTSKAKDVNVIHKASSLPALPSIGTLAQTLSNSRCDSLAIERSSVVVSCLENFVSKLFLEHTT